LKKVIQSFFHALGYHVSKCQRHAELVSEPWQHEKSLRTKNLKYYTTKTGNYYLPADAHKDIIINCIRNDQIFEKEVVELAAQYVQPNTSVLDVGANFGQMSILFSNMVGHQGKVYSFDADDWVYEVFCKNIDANNKRGSIVPHFGAVHDKEGEVLLFPEQDFIEFGTYGSYGVDYTGTKGREVRTITIDGLHIQEPISFMKVDIQGGDLQAMKGAVKTIARNRMPILFEYEYHFEEKFGMCFQHYVDFVSSIDYKFHRVINGHNFLIIPDDYFV
jgi:FkbM family methyltransferase